MKASAANQQQYITDALVQHSGHQTGAQTRMEKSRQRRSFGRITKTNHRNSPVSQGLPHAIIFEV